MERARTAGQGSLPYQCIHMCHGQASKETFLYRSFVNLAIAVSVLIIVILIAVTWPYD